ncbi:anthranilate synthase component I family protein [Paenibacillus athensensis]|nr:anthranilate synthase component I family protein [Paenibacillus athensensis]MCD1261864.1 anthranilate synthase component I family protein [Paenibacillus athensensis]
MLPYIIRLGLADDRVATWRKAWEHAAENAFVLESGKGGRYTYFGLQPISVIQGTGLQAQISERSDRWQASAERTSLSQDEHTNGAVRCVEGKPLELVKEWMAAYTAPRVPGGPKFTGGCVGFWGYDVVRTIERLPQQAAADLPIPDYSFAMYDRVWIIDHQEQYMYVAVHTPLRTVAGRARGADASGATCAAGESFDDEMLKKLYEQAHARAEDMLRVWHDIRSPQCQSPADASAQGAPLAPDKLHIDVEALEGIEPAFRKEDFIRAVERIQTYIGQGDVFQVNLSVRQSRKLHAAPEDIYESLRRVNPSPYMGLLRFADFSLVSGSPELLVQLENGVLRTRPIAGTRPRGRDAQEDARLAGELIHNEKERAEHVMLVDLERNDLGRISRYGSVKVQDFMVIEYYSHVMHIVSEVVGELADGKDAYDVIAATFPGGTITGAPKIRTMEIIEELEPVRRGPYTGSMGWIDYNGDMEFNIIIRTLVAVEGMGHIQAGAGIVIDSVPEREYVESLNKAKAMWKAIELSERSMSRA